MPGGDEQQRAIANIEKRAEYSWAGYRAVPGLGGHWRARTNTAHGVAYPEIAPVGKPQVQQYSWTEEEWVVGDPDASELPSTDWRQMQPMSSSERSPYPLFYFYRGVNAAYMFKAGGDGPWANYVRAYLAKLYELGYPGDTHLLAYIEALHKVGFAQTVKEFLGDTFPAALAYWTTRYASRNGATELMFHRFHTIDMGGR